MCVGRSGLLQSIDLVLLPTLFSFLYSLFSIYIQTLKASIHPSIVLIKTRRTKTKTLTHSIILVYIFIPHIYTLDYGFYLYRRLIEKESINSTMYYRIPRSITIFLEFRLQAMDSVDLWISRYIYRSIYLSIYRSIDLSISLIYLSIYLASISISIQRGASRLVSSTIVQFVSYLSK